MLIIFTRGGAMRQPAAWRKFVVDGLVMHVYSYSRIPASIRKLTKFKGIELTPASKEERAPYIEKEKKHGKV